MKNEINGQRSLIGEKELREYRNFALRDDMLKLAIGVMLGNSFNKVIYGFSDYLIMPIFKFICSKAGEGWRSWSVTPLEGLNFELGRLLGTLVDFVLISVFLYLIYNKMLITILSDGRPVADKKNCPLCCSMINLNATKCPACTGDLNVKPRRNGTKDKRAKDRRSK